MKLILHFFNNELFQIILAGTTFDLLAHALAWLLYTRSKISKFNFNRPTLFPITYYDLAIITCQIQRFARRNNGFLKITPRKHKHLRRHKVLKSFELPTNYRLLQPQHNNHLFEKRLPFEETMENLLFCKGCGTFRRLCPDMTQTVNCANCDFTSTFFFAYWVHDNTESLFSR